MIKMTMMWTVCSASSGNVHASQVPAGLHVSAQCTNAPRPPVYRHPAHLHRCPLYHQGDQDCLHHLPSHG